MYTPTDRKLPSAFAAMFAAAALTFITVAPEPETADFRGAAQTLAMSDSTGVCIERAAEACTRIRA